MEREKIKYLEIKNDETHERFFKHNEIFENKLKREQKEKEELNEKIYDLEQENNRLKALGNDYEMFGNHIIQENDAMNIMVEELQNENIEKEQELHAAKSF